MPIADTDIDIKLSGGAGNTDGDASLGGVISTTNAPTTADGLFDTVSTAEAAAGSTEYRCVYFQNNHGTLTAQNAVVYIQTNTSQTDNDLEIGVGSSGVNGTEQTVANETTAPTGVTFSSAAGSGNSLAIGDIPAGQHIAVWIRRVVNAAAAGALSTATIRLGFDTAQ